MDNTQYKNLILFTENYPYKGGEQFLISDYYYLSTYFKNIYVFTNKKHATFCTDKLPTNLTVLDVKNITTENKKKVLLKNIPILFSLFYSEFFLNQKRKTFISNLKNNLSLFTEALILEEIIFSKLKELNLNSSNSIFHSSWLNKQALVLSISKRKKRITHFTFRANGFDIFNERHPGNYIPFENFVYQSASKAILNSNYSLIYKQKQNNYLSKLDFCYYSIEKHEINPTLPSNTINVVSCSNIIKIKRVDKILKALLLTDKKIHWTHFGDGNERYKIDSIQLPSNITVDLKGKVKNEEILHFYKTTPINLFIHVSETEGLGFSIVEALNHGIPCIACNAGGVIDLVHNGNGKLLHPDVTNKELANEIINFLQSNKNSSEFKKEVKINFNEKFDLNKTISKFYKLITPDNY